MAFNKLSLSEKLLTKAVERGECLVWIGQRDRRGYGFLRLDGRLQRAHRLVYVLHHGPIPDDQVVRHRCDNPSCIRFDHLMLGTQLDNVRDMFERGRANKVKGEANGQSKLTAEQVAEIRRRYEPGKYRSGAGALAQEFGVSKPTVQAILRGETWV